MTSAIETALTELSTNLRRMEQRHQAVGYKFDRLYGLIDEAREELAGLTADAGRWKAVAHDPNVNDVAVVRYDNFGDDHVVVGEYADQAADEARKA